MHTIELMIHNQIHIINSQVLHNLKYKVFAFDRNLHLLAPNSLGFPRTLGMHMIELMIHNQNTIINSQILHNLKYKVFAFDRNLHLLAPNSL